ncbi:hypothetical protein IEQ34_026581 [Dendrobium chrysotoxum]|uniref:Uncharacterized protein n=1 Tax=Dendrobium chrysotoxum TaxID=161865 RepID=A0AAV7FM14_DENCH|nr:hypothetical protein IEQ34_026581 [Dendrobium chrysotoxum]
MMVISKGSLKVLQNGKEISELLEKFGIKGRFDQAKGITCSALFVSYYLQEVAIKERGPVFFSCAFSPLCIILTMGIRSFFC